MLEGHTVDNLIVFGDLNTGATAKGWKIDTPFLGSSSDEMLNDWHERTRLMLKQLGDDEMLHIQWRQAVDFVSALNNYKSASDNSSIEEVKLYRANRCKYFEKKVHEKRVKKAELYIYACSRFQNKRNWFKSKKGLENNYDNLLAETNTKLGLWGDRLCNAFGRATKIQPMKDEDNYWFLRQLLSPSVNSGLKNQLIQNFDGELDIQENCLFSTGAGKAKKARFYIDGRYHSLFVLKKWPKVTYQSLLLGLMNRVSNLTIAANIVTSNSKEELNAEKKALKRLLNQRGDSPVNFDVDVAIEKKKRKIQDIAGGNIRTFEAELIFLLKESTEERLDCSEEELKNAILAMDGAELLEATLGTDTELMFQHMFPAHAMADGERCFNLYAQDEYLADMLPMQTSFVGFLEDAEALYDSCDGGIVGIKSFERGTPQHAILFGMTGAGKSVFMEDLLLQTQPYFDYTVIVEEGLSYLNYTKRLGEEPIIFSPTFNKTLNVFDTFGLPLTTDNVAFVATFVANLLGQVDDETYKLRIAQISEYVRTIYADKAKEWLKKHPDELNRIWRLALATSKWVNEKNSENYIEAWLDFQANGGESSEFFKLVSDSNAEEFSKDFKNKAFLEGVVTSCFASTDFPTLTDLIEVMKGAPKYTHNKEKIFELATRLGAWCDGGVYGNIFDGATTLDLRKKVVHFELGKIPESMGELKSVCGLLVTGVVRQKILSMPRSARKRLIFEEVARFLNVAGGEQIVSEAYAQLRKFGCQTMAIVQQYAQFKNSKIRPVLIGNSKQYFIMRQQDRSDLEDLAKDINLSSAAQEVIQNFSLPEYQSDTDRHSSVFYFNPTVKPDLAGVLKHFVTGCLVVMSGFFGGCGNLTKTTTRAGVIAGGGLVGHSLGKGDKWATAGGVAGGVVTAYLLEEKATSELNEKYLDGYNAGRAQAVKQHYWMAQNAHRPSENTHRNNRKLIPINTDPFVQNGVQYGSNSVYVEVAQ